MKITTLNQLQATISRLNSNMENYIRSIQSTANGVQFLDGNGNVVFTLSNSNAVEKQDPLLSLSSHSLALTVGSASDVSVTRLGDGIISATFIDGSDCAVATVSDTTVSFSASSAGSGTCQINLAETSDYSAASDSIIVTVTTPIVTTGKQDPNLTLNPAALTFNSANDNVEFNSYGYGLETVTAAFSGNGTLSVTPNSGNYYTSLSRIDGNQIVFSLSNEEHGTNGFTETFVVTLSETDDYESDTAVISYAVAGIPDPGSDTPDDPVGPDIPEPDDDDEEE